MSLYRFYASVFLGVLFSSSSTLWSAETFRVGFPSLATGFAPSWVAADKGIASYPLKVGAGDVRVVPLADEFK